MNYNLYSGGLSRPPDVRDARRGDHPVRGRSQRAPADDDGRAARPGRHLGDAVVRRAAGRGRRPARHRAALGRPAQGLLLGRGRAPGARAIASGSRRPGAWSPATSTGPASSASTPGECDEPARRPLRRDRDRDRRAHRPRQRRRPAVHGRPAGRGRLHLDPPRGLSAAADALARPHAGLHRAVRLRPDELPLPDPGPLGRHVHRQGRQRLPAVDPGRADALRAARDRGVPGRPRPAATDRLPGAADRRGRARRARGPARGARPRGGRAAPGGAQLHGRGHARRRRARSPPNARPAASSAAIEGRPAS